MDKPVFLNDKPFPVQVGTPSGAGRIINPGFAVEGNYFNAPVSAGMPLRRLSTSEANAFDKQKILVSLDVTSQGVQAEAVKPYDAPVPSDQELEDQVASTSEVKRAPDAVNNTMAETLDQAMKEMGTQLPTLAELKKMNLQQLNAAAVRFGISQASGRSDIINQLKNKLSLGS